MHETLLSIFAPLQNVHPLIYVLIIAMVPIIELRGAIPIGIALGLPWWQVALVATIGSIIPAPFIIIFLKKFLDLLRRKNWLPGLVNFLDKKFAKHTQKFGEVFFWALVIFVGIPLPGTGAWTGSAIASILELPPKKAMLAVIFGCILAAIIVTLISLLGKGALGAVAA